VISKDGTFRLKILLNTRSLKIAPHPSPMEKRFISLDQRLALKRIGRVTYLVSPSNTSRSVSFLDVRVAESKALDSAKKVI
jgi:hypothetical protein